MIGAGVTINATLRDDNRPLPRTTWTGLIRDGLDYLVQEGYEDRNNRRIEDARRWVSAPDATLQDLLDAAGRLQELLQQHGQFPTSFLREIETLQRSHRRSYPSQAVDSCTSTPGWPC